MAEEGVAGLSLGEIARRMGIRTPSLYVYFPSKHALYDALFARGWQLLLDRMRDYERESAAAAEDLAEILLGPGTEFVRWSVEHPAYAQLLFWRPVPGFAPSEQAYRPAVELYEHYTARIADLQERGVGCPDVEVADVQRDWTVLVAGVVTQQLSNLTRDPWMHRTDIAAATGRSLVLTLDHDGVLVDDVVTEWAQRHRQACTLSLTGPLARSYVFGSGDGPSYSVDAVQLCRVLSGRGEGEGLLGTRVPF